MKITLEKLKKQHLENYKQAIMEIIHNNTDVLVNEDIMSLLRKGFMYEDIVNVLQEEKNTIFCGLKKSLKKQKNKTLWFLFRQKIFYYNIKRKTLYHSLKTEWYMVISLHD